MVHYRMGSDIPSDDPSCADRRTRWMIEDDLLAQSGLELIGIESGGVLQAEAHDKDFWFFLPRQLDQDFIPIKFDIAQRNLLCFTCDRLA